MNETNLIIANFCRLLARIRKIFRKTHIYAKNQPCFKEVSTTVSHSEKEIITVNERLPAVEVSFSIDGDLKEMINDEKYSLGASVAIYYIRDEWKVEGDIGWSCTHGWDDYKSYEMSAKNIDELENKLEDFVKTTLNSYKDAIVEHMNERPS